MKMTLSFPCRCFARLQHCFVRLKRHVKITNSRMGRLPHLLSYWGPPATSGAPLLQRQNKVTQQSQFLLKNTQVRQCKFAPHFTGNFEKPAAVMLLLK